MVKSNPLRKSPTPRDRSPRVKATFPVHAKGGAKGMTQDISATGMFLELDANHKPGSIISFWVELDTPGAKMKLVCEAEVVRVEQADGKIKLGTKIINQELQAITE
ncbi:PilZ domain-containing protein [Polynucleobacter sp. MWH-UH25E]|uniref:PilZ domain-containing protein n=1 Tax=Polynucleobacter sp. MWH-UH25E TaxID=1855616 RepID=UPI001BFE444C|nr:PilZ domain-containing protein [Polynucleobacter sp. MWH-UH25E]QWD61810.1 PilZ domain-containing protein [Polynucleobacter sp. MWH-UH25E]